METELSTPVAAVSVSMSSSSCASTAYLFDTGIAGWEDDTLADCCFLAPVLLDGCEDDSCLLAELEGRLWLV